MNISELFSVIKRDFSRIDNPSLSCFIKHYFIPKGEVYKSVFWMRCVQWARSRKATKYTLGVLFYLFMRKYEYKYGVHLNPNIPIGAGLFVVHGDGVHLNAKSVGENCTIYQGVTVGSEKNGIPTIGNNVTLYTNSVVVGNVLIGDSVVVGANTFVNKDVFDNDTIVGCPGHSIKR